MKTKFDVEDEVLVRGKIIGIGITEEGIKYTVNIDPEDMVYPGSSFEFDEDKLKPVEEKE